MSRSLTVAEALQLARDMCASGRWSEAAAVCSQILSAVPGHAASLHLLGVVSFRQGNRPAAEQWLRKASLAAADFAPAHNDLGNLLVAEARNEEAIAEYNRAVQIAPGFAEAHNNLGNAYQISGCLEESVNCYRRAISLKPEYAEAHRNLGSALRRLGRHDEAVTSFQTALSLNPAYAEAIAQLVQEMNSVCDWSRTEELTRQLVDLVGSGSASVNPFVFLSLETTAAQQSLCAQRWAREHLGAWSEMPARLSAEPAAARRIVLGYLSADFQDHPTAHLTAELFSLHDRNRFRVIAYSYGPNDDSLMRRRLMAAFDDFVDLEHVSQAAAAHRIRGDAVDILVDLKGYTRDARPQIVALRPAPVQVSYLGFPGTMGTRAIDYIIADPFVVPAAIHPHFAERVVHLPDCYQVNDSHRKIADPGPSRGDCGLPESGFVFCCFNAAYKLTPRLFQIWLRLLEAVPGSVLWLLASNPDMVRNLRKEAEARFPGSSLRLVFAPILRNPEHLARLRLADLFLDTLPYNAHTLASDALWAGCPLITCVGGTFASRVAGSLLRAVGLPELITNSLPDYEALALRLAREPVHLEALRQRLRGNRVSAALFDCARFTRNLETAFEVMWRRYQRGEAPAQFFVDPVSGPPSA